MALQKRLTPERAIALALESFGPVTQNPQSKDWEYEYSASPAMMEIHHRKDKAEAELSRKKEIVHWGLTAIYDDIFKLPKFKKLFDWQRGAIEIDGEPEEILKSFLD